MGSARSDSGCSKAISIHNAPDEILEPDAGCRMLDTGYCISDDCVLCPLFASYASGILYPVLGIRHPASGLTIQVAKISNCVYGAFEFKYPRGELK